ncbi:putative phospholipid-binding protein [Escherichia coli]|uniref:Putative phospholipid-binding protein n=1 Tax=Escherichia coli TaxID=562 RepID=A0A2X1JH37_ECOLX|nr:putative phospholipid-binding protein [Escherichia coli]
MGVDGANEVYNEIRQGQPIGLGEASNDTWITTKVRFAALNQRPGEIVQRESDHRKR